jgi:hypothetical protein
MIRRCVFAMLAILLFASCTTRVSRHTWDYKPLSTRPTPRDWKPGAVWTFVSTRKRGETESFTFRVTGEIAQTCSSGTWRKLEVIRGRIPQVEGGRTQPAFTVEGSFLWISLLAPWCDIDDDIRGGVDRSTFTGDRSQGGMMGSDIIGTVRGWRVK